MSLPLSVSLPAMLADGGDREFRQLIYRMIITQSRLVDIRKAIAARVGVSAPQYTMMMAILHLQNASGISIGDLAEHLEVTGPHVTGEVRKLAEMELVRKTVNPHDARGVLVRLSREGKRRLVRTFPFIQRVNDILFEGVTAEEFRALARFNRKFMATTAAALRFADQQGE
ncbi:MAG: MarR family winged helix-turn-helix transcriptional regulator [Pseudorhodoplanes sp.]|uniref:MarR family winged helix-turn-helix transcriptional regulator n=1 Tax=Pseudorhodoplanes sp. TaxID=1934341 RepID=UPI003D10202C